MSNRQTRLADVAGVKGLIGGPFGSNLVSSDYERVGVPVIRGTNLGHGRYVAGEFVLVSEEKVLRDLSRNVAIPGDVVFTQRGTLGQVALIPAEGLSEYVISQSQMRLRVNLGVAVPDFVYYACSTLTFQRQIADNAISTGVPHINLGILSRLTIPLPSLPEQQAIADVLGALDDKVAANFKIVTSSWALAEAEFVQMMHSAQIATTVGEVLTLEYGKPLPATERISGQVDVFGSGGIVGSHNEPFASGPGVVVGRKGTAGAVHWAANDYYPIDTTFYVVPKRIRDHSMVFCYFLLDSLRLSEQNSDSAVPGLNRNEAHAIRTFLPDQEASRRFTTEAMPLVNLAGQADQESISLAATRDALLPQLMSGKLRVRDAEKVLEGVL